MKNDISINSNRLVRLLAFAAILIVTASVSVQLLKHFAGHGQIYGIVQLFYLDEEANIPSAFSSLILLFSAALLGVILLLEKRHGKRNIIYWATLALGFLYLSIDEAVSIHELFVDPIKGMMNTDSYGIFYFAWVIPGSIIVLVAFLFFFKFLLKLPNHTSINFILAGTIYIGGAIGLEVIGGYYAELHGNLTNFGYSMIVTVEESFEMTGVILFIRSLLKYISLNYREIQLNINPSNDIQSQILDETDAETHKTLVYP